MQLFLYNKNIFENSRWLLGCDLVCLPSFQAFLKIYRDKYSFLCLRWCETEVRMPNPHSQLLSAYIQDLNHQNHPGMNNPDFVSVYMMYKCSTKVYTYIKHKCRNPSLFIIRSYSITVISNHSFDYRILGRKFFSASLFISLNFSLIFSLLCSRIQKYKQPHNHTDTYTSLYGNRYIREIGNKIEHCKQR